MTLAPLPLLDDTLQTPGADPELTRDELMHIVREHVGSNPRSGQRTVGCSEAGTPCMRRLGYRLAGVPGASERPPSWLAHVGTSVHANLAEALVQFNEAAGFTRFLVECSVDAGSYGSKGLVLRGSCDVYDRATRTVIDWKIVGVTTLRAARKGDVSQTYRTQIQLYAHGLVRRGVPVERVAIAYLPRNSELTDAFWHMEPYDASVATAAVERLNGLALGVEQLGTSVLPALPRADDCKFCPWHVRRIDGADSEPESNCPGVTKVRASDAELLAAG